MANSNSFLSLPIAQENRYLWIFSYFINCILCVLISIAILMIHLTYHCCVEDRKKYPHLSPFTSSPGAMINPQWLELTISRTMFYGPEDVWVIKVRLFVGYCNCAANHHAVGHSNKQTQQILKRRYMQSASKFVPLYTACTTILATRHV